MYLQDFQEFICVQGMQVSIKKAGKEKALAIIEAFINPATRANYRKIYYKKSGYDRGHMAPAGDFRNSKEKMQDTFYLSNIAPQCPQLNRGYWLKLEKHVRQLAKDHGRVFVITGPVFVPIQKGNKRFVSYEVIGKNDIGVPTHFFKVIRAKNSNGALLQEAYLIPNQQVDQKRSLSEFEVSIEKLERISGLIFERI